MRDIREVYAAFWGGFLNGFNQQLIPAWQEGYVPRDVFSSAYPRITYQLSRPDFLGQTILSASIWDRRPHPQFFTLVDDVLRQAAEKIPHPGGLILPLGDGGNLWIMRSNPFVDYLDEPDDKAIARGIIRVIVKSHIL